MPFIRGRSLVEVRRYDLFKLAVAFVLFVLLLFLFGGAMAPPSAPVQAPSGPTGPAAASPPTAPASAAAIRFENVGGAIRVRGRIPDQAGRDALLGALIARAGGGRIIDELGLSADAARPDWIGRIGKLIDLIGEREGLSLDIDGERVVLEGMVADQASRATIAAVAAATFAAPYVIDNRLALAPASSTATTALAFESFEGRVRVEGVVPDEATRERVLAAAASSAGGAEFVVDALRIDRNAMTPEGLDKVNDLLAGLRSFPGLRVAMIGSRVVLTGKVPDESTRRGFLERVQSMAGIDGVDDQLRVSPPAPEGAAGATPKQSNPVATGSVAAPIVVMPAPVSLFFGEGSTRIADDAGARLAPIARYASGEARVRVLISGYHSKTGSLPLNLEIAKQRAFATRDALIALGVARDRIELARPQNTLGEADDDKARRVDVSIEQ